MKIRSGVLLSNMYPQWDDDSDGTALIYYGVKCAAEIWSPSPIFRFSIHNYSLWN